MRRRGSETRPRIGGLAARDSGGVSGQVDEMAEMRSRDGTDGVQESDRTDKPTILDKAPMTQSSSQGDQQDHGAVQRTETSHTQSENQLIDDSGHRRLSDAPLLTMPSSEATTTIQSQIPNISGTVDLAAVEWSYLDTQGIVQGERLLSLDRLTSESVQAHSARTSCNPGMTRGILPRTS